MARLEISNYYHYFKANLCEYSQGRISYEVKIKVATNTFTLG